jgi:glycosyltransferase involved in cell wall biosynthesis
LKRFVLRFATCISISRAIANDLRTPSTVIPNPYDDDTFYEMPNVARERELIFLGRLIFDKGAHLVLQALAQLKSQGQALRLTIVGAGPEESTLRQIIKDLNISEQVDMVGVKTGKDLATLLNAHQVMVAPSIWEEPFGVVALEGIACGCVVVGSEGGGLKDAIGLCGVTFPNGNAEALSQCLVDLFARPERWADYRAVAPAHLARHTAQAVSAAYLRVLEEAR